MIRKAVIPAAGLGTRFLPATRTIPKEMLPIIDKPVMQFVIEEAVASGITDILIITGKGKNAVEDYFDKIPEELEATLTARGETELLQLLKDSSTQANIFFTRQKKPTGLGDAVLLAEPFIAQEPFAVLLGDNIVVGETPCTKQLIDTYHHLNGTSTLASIRIDKAASERHGVIAYEPVEGEDTLFKITRQIEKPAPEDAPSNIGTIGRYIFTPKIFQYIKVSTPDAIGEVSLTEATNRLAQDEGVYARLIEGTRYDTGDKREYVKAIMDSAKQRGLI